MPRIRFSKPYDHPTTTGHHAYPQGFEGEVSDAVAKAAVKAGRAEAVTASPPSGEKTKS